MRWVRKFNAFWPTQKKKTNKNQTSGENKPAADNKIIANNNQQTMVLHLQPTRNQL
jgi:hypothetical protein